MGDYTSGRIVKFSLPFWDFHLAFPGFGTYIPNLPKAVFVSPLTYGREGERPSKLIPQRSNPSYICPSALGKGGAAGLKTFHYYLYNNVTNFVPTSEPFGFGRVLPT